MWIRTLASALALSLVLASSATASAQVAIWGDTTRAYSAPPNFIPVNAQRERGPQDTTVLSATVGTETLAACVIIVVDDASATAFTYRHEERPTQCVGVIPGPEGGVFVRGLDPTAAMGVASGFTALIARDGSLRWSLSDQALVEARSTQQGGTGQLVGAYERPLQAMAYSPRTERLIAFTRSTLTLGAQQRAVTQAHIVSTPLGRLSVSGQTFGDGGLALIQGAMTRQSDGQFLLTLTPPERAGSLFVSYDGRALVSAQQPLNTSWTQRVVIQVAPAPSQRALVLWTPSAQADAPTQLALMREDGTPLWEGEWPVVAQTATGPLTLGRPLSVHADAEHALVSYLAGGELWARVISMAQGDERGVVRLSQASPHGPVGLLSAPDGALVLLSYEVGARRMRELALRFEDAPVTPGDPDMGAPDMGAPDMGAPDMGEPEPTPEASAQEGCAQGGARAGSGVASWLALLLIGACIARRRQMGLARARAAR